MPSADSSVVVVRLGVADAASFRALRLEAVAQAPEAFSASPADEEAKPAEWASGILSDPAVAVFGAFVGGQLVGVAAFSAEQREKLKHKGGLWSVYVQPAFRGRRIGRQLVEAVIAHASTRVTVLRASVTAGNQAALTLYAALGFEPYGSEPKALCVNGVFHDDVMLSLDLQNHRRGP